MNDDFRIHGKIHLMQRRTQFVALFVLTYCDGYLQRGAAHVNGIWTITALAMHVEQKSQETNLCRG